jgi:spore coat protein CotH
MKEPFIYLVLFCLLAVASPARAQVRISEFMASNTRTLTDDYGQYSDWIEIQNTTTNTVNLLNWALTDSAGTPAKWLFPSTNLAAKGFMVIFASGRDCRIPGKTLHTSFKLSSTGEYLALTRPDGTTASAVGTAYPRQFPDVSYGLAMHPLGTALVSTNATLKYRIPRDASEDSTWMQPSFSDTSWTSGVNGLGYDTGLYDSQEVSYAQFCLSLGPEAYWRLNETNGPAAANSAESGVGNEAGYMGDVTFGTAGPRPPGYGFFEPNNLAPTFNGTDAYVNGPYQLLNNVTGFTMAGWICPTAAQGSRTGLFGQNDLIEFGFIDASTLNLWTPYGQVSYTYPYPANEWHHVAAVGGNGALQLYVDGSLVGSSSVDIQTFGTSEFFFNIGGGGVWDASGNFFKGRIDEVAVWFRALSTSELSQLVTSAASSVSFTPNINTDLIGSLYKTNTTVYLRIPFQIPESSIFDALKLRVRYDDGFVAWMNGHIVATANAPASPAWNSAATARHLDSAAVQWEEFDISGAIPWLDSHENSLAIQGLNISATNTDFLIQAQMYSQTISEQAAWRYFTQPTPGAVNGLNALDHGPIISNAAHSPLQPTTTNSLTITATVAEAFSPITVVSLHYRVMYGRENLLAMNDSGTNGDARAGDGIWTATIPAGIAPAGNMIRYYVNATDSLGNDSRWPIYPDATTSEQYYGTVVANPSVQSHLPVAELFIQNLDDANTRTGTQASLYFNGELYDNITIRIHGQSSAGWPKHSYNIDIPKDHDLLCRTNLARLKNIRFLSNYGDKMRMHTTLTYDMVQAAGGDGHFSFPIRLQYNGNFLCITDMVEDGDDRFVERLGRDPNGALYKMYNDLSSASGNEKKTREWEGTDDLTVLVNNLDPSLPLTSRAAYAWDNLDLPQAASYFATLAIASSQDHGHKNYYLYHDNDGTGEWAILPWDVDLSWGRNWVDSLGYFSDILYTNNVLNFNNFSQQGKPSNRFYDLFFSQPEFRQMYLRRLRTLMDTLLMPPGTPPGQLVIEPVIRNYENLMDPPGINPSDATLDRNLWGPDWGNTAYCNLRTEAERTISTYLAGRRDFLFNSASATLNGDRIPAAQPADASVVIASWDYNPASGSPSEQYVELKNTNTYAIDVSNWQLSGAVSMTLRPGTVIPAGRSIYLTPSVNAFRARTAGPRKGQSLFVQGPFSGYLSASGNSPLTVRRSDGTLACRNASATNTVLARLSPTNLVVLRLGDGTENLTSHGNSAFLDQYATNGVFQGSIAIPNNGDAALIFSGTASSEGALTRSLDGRLLTFAGYNVALSNSAALSASLANSTAAAAPRAAMAVDFLGTPQLTGVTTNQFNKNNVRSSVTDGRGHYWASGAATGIVYFDTDDAHAVETNISNATTLQPAQNGLLLSTAKSTPGLYSVSASTDAVQSPSLLLPTGSGSSPFAFAFSPDGTLVYVADDTLAGRGGVQRWELQHENWTLAYSFASLTNCGARGLAVDFSGVNPVIYATTAESLTNRLISIIDNGPNTPMNTLATAGVNQIFRGVSFGPSDSPAPRLFATTVAGSQVTLAWTTLVGQMYILEYTEDLRVPDWHVLSQFTAAAPETTTAIPLSTEGNRFFRLRLTQ